MWRAFLRHDDRGFGSLPDQAAPVLDDVWPERRYNVLIAEVPMSSPRFLAVIVLLLPLAGLAQTQQAVPSNSVPLPPLAGSLFPHPDQLIISSPELPLDSQRSLLEPKTSINPFEQSLAGDSLRFSARHCETRSLWPPIPASH